MSLCKRRGFIFQSSDIYGGLQGVYDYGPLGVELKNNLKAAWWRAMVYERDDVEGLDAAILTNNRVLHYSGHEETFTDPMVDCRQCKSRWRADHLDGQCPSCGSKDLTDPRPFNLMFKTSVGPVDDGANLAYLRPETAQAIFTNFKHVLDSTSRKLPFGIAQIGKAFRNEITPRNFIFRVREFEQMELEFFVQPGTDESWHERWVEERLDWWQAQGVSRNVLSLYKVPAEELAHYSKATFDVMYRFPHGTEELEGIANRTDFDLGSHTKGQNELNLSARVIANEDSNARLAIQNTDTKTWLGSLRHRTIRRCRPRGARRPQRRLPVGNPRQRLATHGPRPETTPGTHQSGRAALEAQQRSHHGQSPGHQKRPSEPRPWPYSLREHR